MNVTRFLPRALPAVLLFLLALCAGCGGSGPGTEGAAKGMKVPPFLWPGPDGKPQDQRDGCAPLPADAQGGGHFLIALQDSVRPARAPVPGNPGERLVFAQFYETLTRVACDGGLWPGLAETWEVEDDGAVWVFTLRERARLWDGTLITPDVVIRSWDRNGELVEPFPLGILPLQVSARDDGKLEIRPAVPTPTLDRLLAHPAWAVAATRPGWTWPVGSGPARLRASTPAPLPDLTCHPNPQHPRMPRWKQLVFETRPGQDARDLVGLGADLLVVRELAAVRFYRELADHEVVPLPWDRLYLLLCPPGADGRGLRRWREAAAGLAPATDLTSVAAAAWSLPTLPGGETGALPVGNADPPPNLARLDSPLARARLDSLTVIHPDADPAAAELSGRLAALAGRPTRTVGLATDDLETALAWGMSGACVLPVHPAFADPALQLADLVGRRSWLATALRGIGTGDSLVAAERPAGASMAELAERGLVLPLAVSHPWLVHRGPVAGLTVACDGTLQLSGLGAPGAGALP